MLWTISSLNQSTGLEIADYELLLIKWRENYSVYKSLKVISLKIEKNLVLRESYLDLLLVCYTGNKVFSNEITLCLYFLANEDEFYFNMPQNLT